jgi:hypothetical protein
MTQDTTPDCDAVEFVELGAVSELTNGPPGSVFEANLDSQPI